MRENFWHKMTRHLDEDERLIYPEMYRNNRELYDDIRGVAYIVKSRKHPEAGIDWVTSATLDRLSNDIINQDIVVLAKQVIVRLRLPWYKVQLEWTATQEMLDEYRNDLRVVDILLRVQHKDNPLDIIMVDPLEFEMNRDLYTVREARYIVTWKSHPGTEKKLLGIDPDSFSTYMQQ